jgi:hypothetical protein
MGPAGVIPCAHKFSPRPHASLSTKCATPMFPVPIIWCAAVGAPTSVPSCSACAGCSGDPPAASSCLGPPSPWAQASCWRTGIGPGPAPSPPTMKRMCVGLLPVFWGGGGAAVVGRGLGWPGPRAQRLAVGPPLANSHHTHAHPTPLTRPPGPRVPSSAPVLGTLCGNGTPISTCGCFP